MRYEGNWNLNDLTEKLLELSEIIHENVDDNELDGAGFFLADVPDLMKKINEVYHQETGQYIF
jgi:hypothetical protein